MNWLERTDGQVIAHALDMWANYIESGDPVLSAKDKHDMGYTLQPLDTDQMKLIIRLRDLSAKHAHIQFKEVDLDSLVSKNPSFICEHCGSPYQVMCPCQGKRHASQIAEANKQASPLRRMVDLDLD